MTTEVQKQRIVAYDYNPITSLVTSGTLRYLQQELDKLIEKYGEDAVMHVIPGHDNIDEYVSFLREETDAEQKKRLKDEEAARVAEAKRAANKEEQERKEYKRLHKKYGEKK